MKTAISIPDDIFQRGEAMAQRLSKSRSQLYSEALNEYLIRHDPDTVTARLNAAVDELGSDADSFVVKTAGSILSRVEW